MNKTAQTKSYDLAKSFLQGLIYPSILGTFLMDVINRLTQIVREEGIGNYISNLSLLSWEKILLVFGIIFFFCCDYLYSYVTKTYKKQFIYFDIVVIFFLLISFNSINVTKVLDEPNIMAIIFSFLVFLLMFLAWDVYLITKKKNELETGESKFYKAFVIWEIVVILLLCSLLAGSYKFKWPNAITTISTSLIIIASAIFYLSQLPKKNRFELAKEQKGI